MVTLPMRYALLYCTVCFVGAVFFIVICYVFQVETEQILQLHGAWSQGQGSFSSVVMVRGSIPLYWAQTNPWAPKPDIVGMRNVFKCAHG